MPAGIEHDQGPHIRMADEGYALQGEMTADGLEIIQIAIDSDAAQFLDRAGTAPAAQVVEDQPAPAGERLEIGSKVAGIGHDDRLRSFAGDAIEEQHSLFDLQSALGRGRDW